MSLSSSLYIACRSLTNSMTFPRRAFRPPNSPTVGARLAKAPALQVSGRCSPRSELISVPQVEDVLGSVSRVLAVVTVCVAAFLFRAGCILYLVCTDQPLAFHKAYGSLYQIIHTHILYIVRYIQLLPWVLYCMLASYQS